MRFINSIMPPLMIASCLWIFHSKFNDWYLTGGLFLGFMGTYVMALYVFKFMFKKFIAAHISSIHDIATYVDEKVAQSNKSD